MDEQQGAFKPPFMAFATLWSFIEDLASRPLPPQIDRSMMNNKSGTDQAGLLSALASFNLVDSQQRVQPQLVALAASDSDQRKAALATLMRKHYAAAVELSEQHGTHQQLQDLFRGQFGLDSSPDTRRKAITFFLHASRMAGLTVSANFPATRSGSGGPGAPRAKKARTAPRKQTASNPAAAIPEDSPRTTPGATEFSMEVKIKAGTVRLTVDVNPLELRGRDRTFFFDLVDRMEEYEASAPTSPAAQVADKEPEGG